MMHGFKQFGEDRLPAARLGGGSAPPGPPLGLTLRCVACFPMLTALEGGMSAVLHQGLLWIVGGKNTLMITLQRYNTTPQCPQQPEKYFFSIGLTH
jgi:hypothetical protein